MELVDIAAKFGLPGVVILVVYLAIRAMAKWARPYLERVAEAHISLVTTTKDAVVSMKDGQEKHGEALNQIARTLAELKTNSVLSSQIVQQAVANGK